MNRDWHQLRTLDGSQHKAFEELCCQLAAYESAPQGAKFIRVGAPDAGVECYWTLPGEDEWAWQAKFFTGLPDEGQWRQIDQSVQTALTRHPRLTSYTVCMPLDRQEPRLAGQQWFMDKWNARVEKWQDWAEQGRSVEFRYWGNYEIWERLSREEHRGRYYFWFNRELFSKQWFQERLDEAVANAGARYTPALNVELPIARLFDGLGRTTAFFKWLDDQLVAVKKVYRRAASLSAREAAQAEYEASSETMSRLSAFIDTRWEETRPIDWDTLVQLIASARAAAEACSEALERLGREPKAAVLPQERERRTDPYGYERRYLRQFTQELDELEEQAQSNEARLANVAALLLVGDAGKGKTHLLCDVAKQRTALGLPTVLLLGEQFRNDEPWAQIIRLLGLSCDREQFLGALDAAAQVHGERALILIDALNEGEGKRFWSKYLAGVLTALSRYPRLGMAVSVRASYKKLIVPPGLVPARLVRTVHKGFANHEYEATRTFFDHYGIERPSIPMLAPEFQSPLFLKLLCQGLQAGGYTRIPEGLCGLTTIFDFFVNMINEKLAKPEHLNYNPRAGFVQKAVGKLTETFANRQASWLPHVEAQAMVDAVLPPKNYEDSLFRRMITEGLLAEDRFVVFEKSGDDHKYQYEEGIRFAYERLSDHLITQHLLDKYLDQENPTQSFEPGRPLGELVSDANACSRNYGVIEALSIQLPERVGKELGELIPGCADYASVREAFVNSLLWRHPVSITPGTLAHASAHALRYKWTHDQLIDVMLTVATNPNHPCNADFLHGRLMKQEIAERDAWWSIFLHEQHVYYGAECAVGRLVDWAWKAKDKSRISDESIRLAGIALGWFLTTSNRSLRDRATKALVSLLTDRLHVLQRLLDAFEWVNDPYVAERLYAVAYGCAMCSIDTQKVGELAQSVYNKNFRHGEPPPNILLRDYARGVVERALYLGLDLHVEPAKIRPPYKSAWPEDIPSAEELQRFGEWQEGMSDEQSAWLYLYHSIMDHGDFARYIIGTNSGSFEWSSQRLGGPMTPTREQGHTAFVVSLTAKQRKAYERYKQARDHLCWHILLTQIDEGAKDEQTQTEMQSSVKALEQRVRRTLGKKKTQIFDHQVLPYLENPQEDPYEFDLSLVQRWIFQKVIKLGWTGERFGRFDRYVNSGAGRGADKPERIGKKYQWIAYYEVLARVADNFAYVDRYEGQEGTAYEGPWQLTYVRNTDPSVLLERTMRDRWQESTNTWWLPRQCTWDEDKADTVWLRDAQDLPPIMPLLAVKHLTDGSQWLMFQATYVWRQPVPSEEDTYSIERREIWYIINSYLVKRSGFEETLAWAQAQDFRTRPLAEPHELHDDICSGELYWSPNYRSHHARFREYTERRYGDDAGIPQPLMPTTEHYLWGSTYDCSIEDTIGLYVPSGYLAKSMGLTWQGRVGYFCNPAGDLVAFDPSVEAQGPSVLLVRKDTFTHFLRENDLALIWIVHGEKQFVGGPSHSGSFIGRLHVTGAYGMAADGHIEGGIHPKFSALDAAKTSS